MDFKTTPIEDVYEIHEEIGRGQFATVRRCVEKSTRKEFAAKFIRRKRDKASRRGVLIENIKREVNILRELNHSNVVKLFDVFDGGTEVILILELVKGGELFDLISDGEPLEESEAIIFIREILLGLSHMHEKNIAHLDLKPENIMLLDEEDDDDDDEEEVEGNGRRRQQLKLIDFGLSRKLETGSDTREIMGTPEFVAPEIINFEPVTLASDMWALGVIAYNLLSGASPFLGDNKQETFTNITAAQFEFDESFFESVTNLAINFIAKLLVKDPRKRSTVRECLEHPWIKRSNLIIKNELNVQSTKSWQARTRWAEALKLVIQCNRVLRRAKLAAEIANSTGSNNNSGFVHHSRSLDLQEENFVTAALVASVEDGNLEDLVELLKISKLDVNLANRHGETLIHMAASFGHLDILKELHAKGADITLVDNHGDSALYWAARQGHTQIIRYLYEQGLDVNVKNKIGETSIHVAARYGQAEAIEQLCRCGANINAEDDHGETALHIAVWHGFPKIVHVLGDIGANGNVRNKDGETPLHCAAARGHTESTKYLLESGVNLNLLDKYGCTALVLALRRRHVPVAMLLLNAGCDFEIPDGQGDKPIHISAREGLLPVIQRLCSLSCSVNVCNRAGFYPLHLAAKKGHIEIVRRLCLAGAHVETKNRDGITAEISAIAQGFNDIGDLLDKIKPEQVRNEYISQLKPTTNPLSRIKVKIFGHSGVGKTTLVESLKCGYFSSWFRRSSRSTTPAALRVSQISAIQSTSKSSLDSSSPPMTPTSSSSHLSLFQSSAVNNEFYTRGIDVQQVVISGVGDFNVWEFSGQENYHQIYDHFIGGSHCFHVVLFRLCDPPEVQLQQIFYWLHFLQSRMPITEPLTLNGRSKSAAKLILVGTHADLANCNKIAHNNEYLCTEVETIMKSVKSKFQHIFDIHEPILPMDTHVVGSQAMKQLKHYLSSVKSTLLDGVPLSTPLLHLVCAHLQNWRKSLGSFPVMSSQQFSDMIREKINPLTGDNHIGELIQQLQIMGEILYLKGRTDQDLVILNPRWLTMDVIGYLLRPEYLNRNRITGCYSVDDIQLLFPDVDALDLLQVLDVLQLCTQCDMEGDIEYEFPSFINLEKPESLWSAVKMNPDELCYGGVRLKCSSQPSCGHQLSCLFPRIQILLRQCLLEHPDIESLSLKQWRNASRLQSGLLEAIVLPVASDSTSPAHQYEAIEVQVRGPVKNNKNCFLYFEDILSIIETKINSVCPSLQIERHYCKPSDLRKQKTTQCATYNPSDLMKIIMNSTGSNVLLSPVNEKDEDSETLGEILCFGLTDLRAKNRVSNNLRSNHNHHSGSRDVDLTMPPSMTAKGPSLANELHITNISTMTKQSLCALLDPQEPMGRDWCMLGVRLGLTDKLPKLDPVAGSSNVSPTWRLLEECCREEKCTLKFFIEKLKELGRQDAVDMVYKTGPLIKVFPQVSAYEEGVPVADESSGLDSGINCGSQASSSNLSR